MSIMYGQTFIRPASYGFVESKYEHAATIRGNQDIEGAIASAPSPCSFELAPDQWDLPKGFEINQPAVIRGREAATRFQANTAVEWAAGGHMIKINAAGASTIIENIKFHGGDANGPAYGIRIEAAASVTIRNCEFKFFQHGIWVHDSDYVTVDGCKFFDHSDSAVLFDNSDNGLLLNNMVGGCTDASKKELRIDNGAQKNLILGNSVVGGIIYIKNDSSEDNRFGYFSSTTGYSNHATMEVVT